MRRFGANANKQAAASNDTQEDQDTSRSSSKSAKRKEVEKKKEVPDDRKFEVESDVTLVGLDQRESALQKAITEVGSISVSELESGLKKFTLEEESSKKEVFILSSNF